jgi:glycosyltransferase involved in cell wall biosynthesis
MKSEAFEGPEGLPRQDPTARRAVPAGGPNRPKDGPHGPTPLRIVQVNAAYVPTFCDAGAMVDGYWTLTGWARALRRAGASVRVVQRFSTSGTLTRDGVSYSVVADAGSAVPGPDWHGAPIVEAVAASRPDVVHVNGVIFPALVAALRRALGAGVVIVAQDHGACEPPRLHRRLGTARLWRNGFDALDACSFTAREQAEPWERTGWLKRAVILTVVEASTDMVPQPRERASQSTGVSGTPAIVWVGRLNDNKDPMTVLGGLELAMRHLPGARAWMIYREATLEPAVAERIRRSPALSTGVTLVGSVPHDAIAGYLSAADIYVSGSHREGSGYALIEAMACGAAPVVTDIPSFRAIAGDCGCRWPPGDAKGCAEALLRVARADVAAERVRVRTRFERALSWSALGDQTLKHYRELVAGRGGRTAR